MFVGRGRTDGVARTARWRRGGEGGKGGTGCVRNEGGECSEGGEDGDREECVAVTIPAQDEVGMQRRETSVKMIKRSTVDGGAYGTLSGWSPAMDARRMRMPVSAQITKAVACRG